MGGIIVRVLAFIIGLVIVWLTLSSAVRTFVLPRSVADRLARWVFIATRQMFNLRTRWYTAYADIDRIMALYAPVSLLVLLVVWLACILAGYTLMFWSAGSTSWRSAFLTSGSSLLTLGFATVGDIPAILLAFSEATIGLILIALLIGYLPTMYTAFARREAAVSFLEVRAGSPPSAVEMILRYCRLGRLSLLHDIWNTWEAWFIDVEESHTSLAALAFFRSPQPHHSWVTAAGTVLDAASLVASTVDVPRDPEAELCIRAGSIALRRIAQLYSIPVPEHPQPTDLVSVGRDEFDVACRQLAAGGVPLKPDLEAAWRSFSGWRVNYDVALLRLARMTQAPSAPWTSDRTPLGPMPGS